MRDERREQKREGVKAVRGGKEGDVGEVDKEVTASRDRTSVRDMEWLVCNQRLNKKLVKRPCVGWK